MGASRLCVLLTFGAFVSACEPAPNPCDEDGASLYARRIEPLLIEDRPSTCNQCHLSGVDLSLFVRETPCETMACLVELGLVDLESPDESVVLAWIDRARPQGLITESVIDAEREAFHEWIQHTGQCGGREACAGTTCGAAPVGDCALRREFGTEPPSFDPSDCSPVAREQAFLDGVYAWRGRCFPCHYIDNEIAPPEAPRWIDGSQTCGPSSLDSMNALLALGAVNFEDPEASLLLLKPLAEAQGGVVHGGHDKFGSREDTTYQSFLAWIEYEASCRD